MRKPRHNKVNNLPENKLLQSGGGARIRTQPSSEAHALTATLVAFVTVIVSMCHSCRIISNCFHALSKAKKYYHLDKTSHVESRKFL
jgi:hypothetical protein